MRHREPTTAQAHRLSHPGATVPGMIPIDLVLALSPTILWACLWLADWVRQ